MRPPVTASTSPSFTSIPSEWETVAATSAGGRPRRPASASTAAGSRRSTDGMAATSLWSALPASGAPCRSVITPRGAGRLTQRVICVRAAWRSEAPRAIWTWRP